MSNFILKYKAYLIGIAIAATLALSFNWYVDRKEAAAYEKGFASANSAWMKKGKEYVDMIDAEKADNTALNERLAVISEEKRILEQKKAQKVVDKQIEYVKSPSATNKSLDDGFVELYNESLGE